MKRCVDALEHSRVYALVRKINNLQKTMQFEGRAFSGTKTVKRLTFIGGTREMWKIVSGQHEDVIGCPDDTLDALHIQWKSYMNKESWSRKLLRRERH